MRVGAGGDDTAVLQPGDRIHGGVMKAHHLLGHVALKRPTDGGGIETAGDGLAAVRRDRQRTHRAAMAAQLRLRRGEGERQQQEGKGKAFDTKRHDGLTRIARL